MRRLLPPPEADATEPIDLEAAYAPPPPAERPASRPFLRLNMIASADGATAVDGRSGGLGGPADREVFHVLRAQADVVLVGATTVRAERYGPPRAAPSGRRPRLAIVTASGDLDWSWPLFADDPPPLLCIPEDAAVDPPPGTAVTFLRSGTGRVDLAGALRQLGELGAAVVLCEGGPSLNGQLLAAGLVDELCLTVAPALVAGTAARVATGPPSETSLELRHVLEDAGMLLLRYASAPITGA